MKSRLLNKLILFAFALFVSSTAFAQVGSPDPNNPKPLATNTVMGKLNEKKAVYYYSFTGGPGTITLTAEGKANIYSCIVEAYLIDANGKEIGLVQITPDTGGQMKGISRSVSSEQKMTLRVELDRVASDTVDWKISLGGAVSLGMADQPKLPIKIPGKKANTNKNTGVKIKIPGQSDTPKPPTPAAQTPPPSGQTPSLISLFKLTPQKSYNDKASLDFYSPAAFSAKESVAKFSQNKGSKIALKLAAEPGFYRIVVDVQKVAEFKGTNNKLQLTNTLTEEVVRESFETNGRQTLTFQIEITTPATILEFDAVALSWNFYSVEVKRLKN